MKTPEQIAAELYDPDKGWAVGSDSVHPLIIRAIEADRAQRQPEIYIVQNDMGDIVDVFRDADEATDAYQDGYHLIEETVWEPGEYAAHITEGDTP